MFTISANPIRIGTVATLPNLGDLGDDVQIRVSFITFNFL